MSDQGVAVEYRPMVGDPAWALKVFSDGREPEWVLSLHHVLAAAHVAIQQNVPGHDDRARADAIIARFSREPRLRNHFLPVSDDMSYTAWLAGAVVGAIDEMKNVAGPRIDGHASLFRADWVERDQVVDVVEALNTTIHIQPVRRWAETVMPQLVFERLRAWRESNLLLTRTTYVFNRKRAYDPDRYPRESCFAEEVLHRSRIFNWKFQDAQWVLAKMPTGHYVKVRTSPLEEGKVPGTASARVIGTEPDEKYGLVTLLDHFDE